jgi:hypothetical protein
MDHDGHSRQPRHGRRRDSGQTQCSEPTPGTGAAELLRRMLWQRWKKFRKHYRRSRRECAIQTVHNVRTSLRRLLTVLDLVEVIQADRELEKTRRRLKKLSNRFSVLRDIQQDWEFFHDYTQRLLEAAIKQFVRVAERMMPLAPPQFRSLENL